MDTEFSQFEKAEYYYAGRNKHDDQSQEKLTSNWPDMGEFTPKGLEMFFVDVAGTTLFQHKELQVCLDFMANYSDSVLRHVVMTGEQLDNEKAYHNKWKDLNRVFKR